VVKKAPPKKLKIIIDFICEDCDKPPFIPRPKPSDQPRTETPEQTQKSNPLRTKPLRTTAEIKTPI